MRSNWRRAQYEYAADGTENGDMKNLMTKDFESEDPKDILPTDVV